MLILGFLSFQHLKLLNVVARPSIGYLYIKSIAKMQTNKNHSPTMIILEGDSLRLLTIAPPIT